ITTRTSRYSSSSSRSSSRTCRQLMQQNVQKSSSTILPRSSARLSSRPPVLSQPRPSSSEARTRGSRSLTPVSVHRARAPCRRASSTRSRACLPCAPDRGGRGGRPAHVGDGALGEALGGEVGALDEVEAEPADRGAQSAPRNEVPRTERVG